MLCNNCKYFKITPPVKFLDHGLAKCTKFNMEVKFNNLKQLKRLRCISSSFDQDYENMKNDWKKVGMYFTTLKKRR